MITYRRANPEDVYPALELALRVFMEFDAPDFEPAYAANFKNGAIKNDAYIERLLLQEGAV